VVFDQRRLREHINRYLTVVRREFAIERVVLYGSYAYGRPRDGSDIDLIILSGDFVGMPKLIRHQRLGWLAWQAGTDYIQPLGFTPEEFGRASPASILSEIRECGVVVYEAEGDNAQSGQNNT
jgi:hypothetical protein